MTLAKMHILHQCLWAISNIVSVIAPIVQQVQTS